MEAWQELRARLEQAGTTEKAASMLLANPDALSSSTEILQVVPSYQVRTALTDPRTLGAGADLRKAESEASLSSTSSTEPDMDTLESTHLEFLEELGAGRFGAVYRGVYKDFPVAIKVLRTEDAVKPSNLLAAFRKEVTALKAVRSKYCIRLFGATEDPPTLVRASFLFLSDCTSSLMMPSINTLTQSL